MMRVEFTLSGYKIKHGGSGAAYANYGCRCDECTEANRVRIVRRRSSRKLSEFKGEHGKESTYTNWTCRCKSCSEAHAKVCKAYYRRSRRGH